MQRYKLIAQLNWSEFNNEHVNGSYVGVDITSTF